MYALNYVFVSKSSFLAQKSLAAINIFSYSVDRIFFNSLPISSAVNNGGIYVSTYTSKKVYLLDSLIGGITDSIYVPSNGTAIGDLISGSPLKLYVVGGNAGTAFTGREVWRIDLLSQPPNVELLISSQDISGINGIGFEPINNEIFISDTNGGGTYGEVRVYDAYNGNWKKTYPVGGRNPAKLAFHYKQVPQ